MTPTNKTLNKDEKRTEQEQLEFQRNNPHLFTALTQCVEPYGQITTFADVTQTLRKTLEQLDEHHKKRFGGEHPIYCLRPIIGQPENPICASIELCNRDLDRVRMTFVNNYNNIRKSTAPKEVNQ